MELLNRQEEVLEHFESHLNCFKGLLNQYKIESFERSMSNLVSELHSLKFMVTETLSTGSNYLFAKYDSAVNESSNESCLLLDSEHNASSTVNSSSSSSSTLAYNRILSEMAGLSAAQTVEQLETRRKEISHELNEKLKICSVKDFEKFRSAIQKLNNTTNSNLVA